MAKLDDVRVAILAADGVEEIEILEPRKALDAEGATTQILSLDSGSIQTMEADVNEASTLDVDRRVADASVDDYDALVLPGGTTNPDKLRMNEAAVAFVRAFAEAGKPIGVICHGPWTLVEAGVVAGRTLTSWPSVRTDIANAGGTVVDQEVVVDGNLVSSRGPDDIPAFCAKLVEVFAAAH